MTGVTTAGHCTGTNGIVHPGHAEQHTFIFQAEHRGGWGDIEWHTTNFAEVDDFYATATEIRDVGFLEAAANIAVGEPVCVYGRKSNSRDCSLLVADVSISCTDPDEPQFPNDRLVQMNGMSGLMKGDSGGGWSLDFRAFGSTKGICGSRDAWSVADYYDEALGVTVLTL